ncbi:putative membrane protein [Bacillus ectoiniformans]|uniref:DUF2254 domain-containing protein n=1 Tax=Bacillus ectoiniformans TaxID=1494429 RepID=UPI00195BE936|nr:DUF2254 domain-containing protein [Bacillus ectoiniformans]MBM7649610.1 putative membrane protein [Bacillus ectoiniformans]
MKERWDLKIKSSIWLIPSLYSLAAFTIATIVIWLDINHYEELKRYLPDRLLTSVDLAETILGSLAGALLTMTTITFSTLMVVLTTYSGQFSPRTLQNFIRDQVTLRVLGVFMGGFVYSVFSLLFIREQNDAHPVISAAVGVLFAFICLAYFAYFLQHVANSIQVNKLINHLTDEAMDAIDNMKKRVADKEEACRIMDKPDMEQSGDQVTILQAGKHGYAQLYELERLYKMACEEDCQIEIIKPIGSFLSRKSDLIKIYHQQEMKADFLQAVKIGSERVPMQDLEFSIQKLGEVTLRALAPGSNDPNTAIDGVRHIGMCLDEASELDGRYIVYYEGETPRVVIAQKPFEEVLYRTFYEICYSSRDRVSVLLAVFEALVEIAEKNKQEVKEKVQDFGQYVLGKLEEDILNETDKERVKEKFMTLESICEVSKTVTKLL